MIPFNASGAFRPVAEGSELRRLAGRGAAAAASAQGLGLALQVVGTVILARLLTAADFGVVAVVTTFILLLMSFGSNGFHEAVIDEDGAKRLEVYSGSVSGPSRRQNGISAGCEEIAEVGKLCKIVKLRTGGRVA